MDLRKIKKLIDLLEESNLSEIEIKEGEESVRLARQPKGGIVHAAPVQIAAPVAQAMPMQSPVQAATGGSPKPEAADLPLKTALDTYQRQLVQQALEKSQGNWAAAARRLGLDTSNLHKLSRRLGLK